MQLWICLPLLLSIAIQGLLGYVGPGRSVQLFIHTTLVITAYTIMLLHVMSAHLMDLEIYNSACSFEPRCAMQEWGVHVVDGVPMLFQNQFASGTRCATFAMQNIMSSQSPDACFTQNNYNDLKPDGRQKELTCCSTLQW